MTLNEQLIEQYLEIFKNPEYQPLIQAIANDQAKSVYKNNVGLSNILLGFVPDNYVLAEHKILIVGRETRGWLSGKIFNCYNEQEIVSSMGSSQRHFNHMLSTKRSKISFFGFVQNIAKKTGEEGLLWANIFAVDCKETNPKNNPLFKTIKQLSTELLNAQIDILKPDFVLFLNGNGESVKMARNEYFTNLHWTGKGFGELDKRYLEQCFLYSDDSKYQPTCYRTYHPAFRKNKRNIKSHYNAQKGLATLVEILPSKSP